MSIRMISPALFQRRGREAQAPFPDFVSLQTLLCHLLIFAHPVQLLVFKRVEKHTQLPIQGPPILKERDVKWNPNLPYVQ
jgi:hypothetical protein